MVRYNNGMDDISYNETPTSDTRRGRGSFWQSILAVFDSAIDALAYDFAIIRREADIFLGSLLFLVGVLDFHSGKYCDGNTADYLSCTRPVTYYYYTWIEIILIILGITFILLWFMKRERR
jgi:hypothetical protein